MVLDEYYDKYANKVRAEEWLREHVWNSLNDDEADWIRRKLHLRNVDYKVHVLKKKLDSTQKILHNSKASTF
jgi:hypothetical protein